MAERKCQDNIAPKMKRAAANDTTQKSKQKKPADNRAAAEQLPKPRKQRPPPPNSPKKRPGASTSSRLPNGVSGWLELSARHRSFGVVGNQVFQRRFFEIDWHARRITYYNAAMRDGEFYRGVGRQKFIPMSSIQRLDHPSHGVLAGHFTRARRMAAFDIVSSERIYTVVPLMTHNIDAHARAVAKAREHDISGESNTTGGPFKCFMTLPDFSSDGSKAANCSRCGAAAIPEPTLLVDDFEFCIVSRDFNDQEAHTQLARILLSRQVTETGVPWEFECPLTLDIMDDPVLAADGYSYERCAIESWFKKQPILSPLTHQPISSKLKPNFRLREEIAAYEKARLLIPYGGSPMK